MRVDRIIRDLLTTLKQLAQALDNNITVEDNFGVSGKPSGWIIVSRGPNRVPVWAQPGEEIPGGDGTVVVGERGPKGDDGQDGADGVGIDSPFATHYLDPVVDPTGPSVGFAYDSEGQLTVAMGWRPL